MSAISRWFINSLSNFIALMHLLAGGPFRRPIPGPFMGDGTRLSEDH
jgi:hypothetical protein